MTQVAAEKPTIVFDGECGFCVAQIKRIKALDPRNQFEYLARQDPSAEPRFPVLKSVDFNKGMRLIIPGGGNYAGADAIYEIARRLPGIRLAAWLYCVPGVNQIAKLVYAWVAANRKRLGKSCDEGSCETFP